MNQATLFAKTLCHKTDPETSRQAAEKIVKSGGLARQQRCVLECIKSSGFEDFTALELAEGVKNEWYYIIQRRLHELPQIENTGARRDGYCVWRLV